MVEHLLGRMPFTLLAWGFNPKCEFFRFAFKQYMKNEVSRSYMVIVVGAGPSGLATAYYLQQRGIPFCILEKNSIGFAWQNHYDSLHLHTMKEVSGLPGLPMARHYPRFPSAEQLHSYLDLYAQHFEFDIKCGVEVLNATYDNTKWDLRTNQGVLECDTLIVATGIWSTPYCATFKGQGRFGGLMIHARDYKNPAPFIGKRVLVIGAGNSGTEMAVELSENGADTAIAIRSGTTFIPYPTSVALVRSAAWFFRTFPRAITEPVLNKVRKDFTHLGISNSARSLLDLYPVVGYELPEAVERGDVKVYGGISHLSEGGVHFKDGQEVPFDAIILATGYRPTVSFVSDYLELDAKGYPILQKGRSTLNRNLFCVGFYYPATEGFLQSVGRFARMVVQQVEVG